MWSSSTAHEDLPVAQLVQAGPGLALQQGDSGASAGAAAAAAAATSGSDNSGQPAQLQPPQLQPSSQDSTSATAYVPRHNPAARPSHLTAAECDRVLDTLTAWAEALDARWRLGPLTFGADSIIGLIPGGDLLTTAAAGYLASYGGTLGLPLWLKVRLWRRVAVDGLLGMVPLLGDLADTLYKANLRNVDDILCYYGRASYSQLKRERGRARRAAARQETKARKATRAAARQQRREVQSRSYRNLLQLQADMSAQAAAGGGAGGEAQQQQMQQQQQQPYQQQQQQHEQVQGLSSTSSGASSGSISSIQTGLSTYLREGTSLGASVARMIAPRRV